jgi:hypothetical protein
MGLRAVDTLVYTIFCMSQRRYKFLPSINLPDAAYRPSNSSAEPCKLYRGCLCRRLKSIFRTYVEALCLLPQHCPLYIHTDHNTDATVLSMGLSLRACLIMYITMLLKYTPQFILFL